jgi:hypothetical protein
VPTSAAATVAPAAVAVAVAMVVIAVWGVRNLAGPRWRRAR